MIISFVGCRSNVTEGKRFAKNKAPSERDGMVPALPGSLDMRTSVTRGFVCQDLRAVGVMSFIESTELVAAEIIQSDIRPLVLSAVQ